MSMTHQFLIKTRLRWPGGRYAPLSHFRPRRKPRWTTQAKSGSLDAARMIASQMGLRSDTNRRCSIFHRGKIVARLAVAIAAGLLVACEAPPRHGYGWEVRQDPAGLGYWAGPSGGRMKYHRSAYSPGVNRAGGPDR